MYEIEYGNKYEETKDLDIKDVAKLIRKDLKKAHPGVKFSVRIQRYADGQSINTQIKELPKPKTFQLYHSDWLREVRETGRYPYQMQRYTDEAKALLDSVKSLVESYNYDGSDTMFDYYNVRFYKDVRFHHELEKAREKSEKVPAPAPAPAGINMERHALELKLVEARYKVDRLNEEIAELEDQISDF